MIKLIDGDLVAYRTAASCEPTKAKAYLEDKETALLRCEDLVHRILLETTEDYRDDYKIFLGGADNFRYQIYPDYKAKRKDSPKPTWLEDTRRHLVVDHNAIICDGIESDDAMGIEQCRDPQHTDIEEANTIICTNDKDLNMIPGWHFNPVTSEAYFVNELSALKHFYQQLIQGDLVDNIPGFDHKMRPKIPKFLQPHVDALWSFGTEQMLYGYVLSLYLEAGNTEETMHRNAKLLWIWRKENDVWIPPVV